MIYLKIIAAINIATLLVLSVDKLKQDVTEKRIWISFLYFIGLILSIIIIFL